MNSGSNPSSDEEHVRELDVDEAFEHWSELAKRLGAAEPADETWDESSSTVVETVERVERSGPPSAPSIETDWREVATTLGVPFADDEPETVIPDVVVEAREVRPVESFGTDTGSSIMDRPRTEAAPSESVPDSWRSIWGEADATVLPQDHSQKSEQAALDRMFGADSTRVYEDEEKDRSRYFDLVDDEEDTTSEVRFAPREQPREQQRERHEETGEAEGRGSRNSRHGRRDQPRRRGRRSDARQGEQPAPAERPASTPADDYVAESGFADDDVDLFESDVTSDDDIDSVSNDNQSDSAGSRRGRGRKVASWKEAIGRIVDRNLANRDREPSDGHRRRRGGRRR